jgi:hypothetical protein
MLKEDTTKKKVENVSMGKMPSDGKAEAALGFLNSEIPSA